MRRLGWVGWLSLFFLLTIACTFRFGNSTPGASSSIGERTQEREVVRDVIIVTPLATLTPTPSATLTPTPTLTPTIPITQAGQTGAGSGPGGNASDNSENGANGGLPAGTASASPVSLSPTVSPVTTTPPLPTTSVPTVAPTATSTGLLPSATPVLPTATLVPLPPPPDSGGNSGGGNGGNQSPPPLPLVAFSAANFTVNENAGSISLTVVLNSPASQTVTVTVEDTFNGTADSGDYFLSTTVLTFMPGTSSSSVSLSLIDDSLIEGSETVELLLTNPANADLGAPARAVVTIVDDDTLIVNSTDDTDDGACNITHCSLREVINAANAKPGPDTISFNIPGPGPQTITPNAALPTITDPVTIDGTTQPDANCAGWPPTLLIELDGSSAGGSGLVIDAGNSTVRGLVINRFSGSGLELTTNGSDIIECNFIGTDLTGSTALGNAGEGVLIVDAPNSTIGGSTPTARNLISGNSGVGISIGNTLDTLVQGNFIGTDVTGTTALGNSGGGVSIFLSNNTTIGGTSAGARNLISGNGSDGVSIFFISDNSLIQGNFIGTDVTGKTPLGNVGDGVFIDAETATTTVGGTTAGAANRIAFNNNNGVTIRRSSNIFVVPESRGNRILLNSIFGNSGLGIDLGPDGITPNDPLDGDSGPNDFQNFPILNLVTTGNDMTVAGTLTSTANTTFRLEFFTNNVCDPSGNGEGKTFLGSFEVTTGGTGDVFFERTFAGAAGEQFVTATATDPAGNTSEFSACQVPSGQFFVNGRNNNAVRRYNGTSGAFVDDFAVGGGLSAPTLGLAFGPDGNLYVSSGNTNEILRYEGQTGAFIDSFASGGGLNFPASLVFGPDGNLYASSGNTNEILRYEGQTGAFIDSFASGGGLNQPRGLVFGPDGNLYVSGQFSNAVLRYDGTTGAFIDVFATSVELNGPIDLRFGPDGNLYVSSFGTNEVLRYDGTTGAFIDVFASGGGLDIPTGLTFGPDGQLYVSSSGTSQILRYDGTTGAFIDIFIDGGGLVTPDGLLFAP